MNLDLTSLRCAIQQLDEAIGLVEGPLSHANPSLHKHVRAGAIQAFEFTFELCVKLLRRYLIETEISPEDVNTMTFVDIVRRGYELGLLNRDVTAWRNFRRDRGITSHTYSEAKADAVYHAIPAVLEEAKYLLAQLESRLHE